jgi:hypothetical protein
MVILALNLLLDLLNNINVAFCIKLFINPLTVQNSSNFSEKNQFFVE